MASRSQTVSLHGDAASIESTDESLRERDPARHPDEQLTPDDWIGHPPFRWDGQGGPTSKNEAQRKTSVNEYVLECFCKRVRFSISSDPVDVKICHCDTCKTLHGAPMQVAAIFHKTDAQLAKGGVGDISFFSPSLPDAHLTSHATPCPRKIYCSHCGSPLADEGNHMFIAYPSSMRPHKSLGPLGSGQEGSIATQESIEKLPPAFNVRKHIFYGRRAFDMWDGVEKWEGLDGKSIRMTDDGSIIK